MSRSERAVLRVTISEANRNKLDTLISRHGSNRGIIIDEALSLLFTPPDRRPGAELSGPLARIENAIDRLDAAISFQTDLLIEFIHEWLLLQEAQADITASAERAKERLESLIERIVDNVRSRSVP